MAGTCSWLDGNWFNLIQTVGIMGTLLLASGAAYRDAKAKEVENLLTLTELHRELWEGVSRKTELERIFRPDADTDTKPPTVIEEEFLNLVFIHFQTGWTVARSGALITLAEMKADVRGFFTLPLPKAVWEKTKQFRNPKFVWFVERALVASR